MGEEWGSSSPFQFFSSHAEPELARATAEGRKREFAEHGWDADEIPDPQDPETFLRSKLNWDEIDEGDHRRLRRLYHELLALRRDEPDMADHWLDHMTVAYDENQRWIVMHRGSLAIVCNLNADAVTIPVTGEPILAWGEPAIDSDTTQLGGHSFAVLRTS
jgi:maltooligosyltrehalose trehalohydrolase